MKNTGRLEDKDFSAMALLCSGFFGRHDIGEFGARCTAAISIDRRNRRHENRTRSIATIRNLNVGSIGDGFLVPDFEG